MIPRRPVVIANEIRLKRSQHQGAFLVVEGRSDRLFCQRFIDTSVNIVVAESKNHVVDVIKILDDDHFLGALGMIDADFDRIQGGEQSSANLILSEMHDLETMLIRSPALDPVLVEFGSIEKLENFGTEVRDALIAAALPIGCLRLYSQQIGLNLRFQNLDYSAFVDQRSLEINRQRLIQVVKNHSQRPALPNSDLDLAIETLGHAGHDPWQLCTGGDLVSILSIGLRRALGSNSSRIVDSEDLCRSLRLAYGDNEFEGSYLAKAFRQWEIKNPNYRILR